MDVSHFSDDNIEMCEMDLNKEDLYRDLRIKNYCETAICTCRVYVQFHSGYVSFAAFTGKGSLQPL